VGQFLEKDRILKAVAHQLAVNDLVIASLEFFEEEKNLLAGTAHSIEQAQGRVGCRVVGHGVGGDLKRTVGLAQVEVVSADGVLRSENGGRCPRSAGLPGSPSGSPLREGAGELIDGGETEAILSLQVIDNSFDRFNTVADAVRPGVVRRWQFVIGHGTVEEFDDPEGVADLGGAANQANQIVLEEVKLVEEQDVAPVLIFQPRQVQRLLSIEKAVEGLLERDGHQADLWTPFEGDAGKERLHYWEVSQLLIVGVGPPPVVRTKQGRFEGFEYQAGVFVHFPLDVIW